MVLVCGIEIVNSNIKTTKIKGGVYFVTGWCGSQPCEEQYSQEQR